MEEGRECGSKEKKKEVIGMEGRTDRQEMMRWKGSDGAGEESRRRKGRKNKTLCGDCGVGDRKCEKGSFSFFDRQFFRNPNYSILSPHNISAFHVIFSENNRK